MFKGEIKSGKNPVKCVNEQLKQLFGSSLAWICFYVILLLSTMVNHQENTHKKTPFGEYDRCFNLVGGFKHFLCSPLFREDSHFDYIICFK